MVIYDNIWCSKAVILVLLAQCSPRHMPGNWQRKPMLLVRMQPRHWPQHCQPKHVGARSTMKYWWIWGKFKAKTWVSRTRNCFEIFMLDVLVNCTQTLGSNLWFAWPNQLGHTLVQNARSLELGNELQRDCLPSTITTAAAATTTTKKEMLTNQQIFWSLGRNTCRFVL